MVNDMYKGIVSFDACDEGLTVINDTSIMSYASPTFIEQFHRRFRRCYRKQY